MSQNSRGDKRKMRKRKKKTESETHCCPLRPGWAPPYFLLSVSSETLPTAALSSLAVPPRTATTTIYKTVQCLFIGTLGYSTDRKHWNSIQTSTQYLYTSVRHTHTLTVAHTLTLTHRTQRHEQQWRQLWPGAGCVVACRGWVCF